MAKSKKQTAQTSVAMDATPARAPAAKRDSVGMPIFSLVDGPYKGEEARGGHPDLRVTFFPDRLIVLGEKGSAVYNLEDRKAGRVGVFSHYG